MTERREVEVKRVWRYTGLCSMGSCSMQARFLLVDLTGKRHFLCPGHKDAALAALSAFTP